MLRADYALWTNRTLAALAVFSAALWISADHTYFVKSITESHNIILVATNVRDLVTFLVQDVAASPDPGAHPYWYIHHPNLFAKILSMALGSVGLGLGGQVGAILALNIAALLIVAAAFRRFSGAAALAAIAIAATSYGSFHFNAGDLCRGPLYLLLWPLLYALIANPTLASRRLNILIGAVSALGMVSDWGFGLFVVAFAFFWAAVGRGYVPWRWFIGVVFMPAAIALIGYELAVISAVGLDFFLVDAKVTYLGRLGVGEFVDYQSLISRFHDHNVVIWPTQGAGANSILQLIAAVVIMPLMNTGPAWVLLLPVVICAVAWTLMQLDLGRRAWSAIAAALVLNIVGLLPLPLLSIVALVMALRLPRVPTSTPAQRLAALVACVVMGLVAGGLIFPAFTANFTIGVGRPPLPLLEMSAAALIAQIAVSGVLGASDFRSRSDVRLFGGIIAATLAAAVLAVISSRGPVFGMPRALVIGAMLLMAGVPLAVAIGWRANDPAAPSWLTWTARWQIAVLLTATAIALALHTSANPAILGRYSLAYFIVLALAAFAAAIAAAVALVPAIHRAARDAAESIWSAATSAALASYSPSDRQAVLVISLLAAVQLGWLGVSVVAQPPKAIPYAAVLEQPQFRGKSFLASTYEGVVWYSTKGWAYMTPANPPPEGPLSTRFRHFADWRDAKYGRPDFYLCDNTRYSYVPPGTAMEDAAIGKISCTQCTCRDVAAELAGRGHETVVDRDDFSITRFRWGPAE
jgi:hypothetical protein